MGKSTVYVLVLLSFLNVTVHLRGAEGPSNSLSSGAEGPSTPPSPATAEGLTFGESAAVPPPLSESMSGMRLRDKLDPTTAEEWLTQGRIALKARDEKTALDCFEQATLRDPKNVEALLEAGATLGQMGRNEGALAKFLAALIIDKKNVMGHFNAGQAYQGINKPAKAVYHFKQVLQYKPRDWMAREKLIQLYQKMEKPEEVEKQREYLIKMHKNGEVPLRSFAREEFKIGPYQVIVYENFLHQVLGRRPVFLNFLIYTRKHKRYLRRYSLGSFEVTNEIARRSGRLKEDERLYHLDLIDGRKSKKRKHVVSWVKKPDYEKVRKVVYERLEEAAEANK